jgi:hypothetical protein
MVPVEWGATVSSRSILPAITTKLLQAQKVHTWTHPKWTAPFCDLSKRQLVPPLPIGLFALVAADFSETHDLFKRGGASFDVLPAALLQRAHTLLDCGLADRAR